MKQSNQIMPFVKMKRLPTPCGIPCNGNTAYDLYSKALINDRTWQVSRNSQRYAVINWLRVYLPHLVQEKHPCNTFTIKEIAAFVHASCYEWDGTKPPHRSSVSRWLKQLECEGVIRRELYRVTRKAKNGEIAKKRGSKKGNVFTTMMRLFTPEGYKQMQKERRFLKKLKKSDPEKYRQKLAERKRLQLEAKNRYLKNMNFLMLRLLYPEKSELTPIPSHPAPTSTTGKGKESTTFVLQNILNGTIPYYHSRIYFSSSVGYYSISKEVFAPTEEYMFLKFCDGVYATSPHYFDDKLVHPEFTIESNESNDGLFDTTPQEIAVMITTCEEFKAVTEGRNPYKKAQHTFTEVYDPGWHDAPELVPVEPHYYEDKSGWSLKAVLGLSNATKNEGATDDKT